MSTEKSELHITDIERVNKGMWVAAARLEGIPLSEWVIEVLNDASSEKAFKACEWAKGLSSRSAICLIRHGFKSKAEVKAAFHRAKAWTEIMNFGPAQDAEVLEWLKHD